MFNEILERFAQNSPIAVMTHSLLENLLSANKIDHWFDSIDTSQYTRTILFSSIVELMLAVVCKVRPSVNSSYRDSDIPASIVAVYDKLKNIEITTSQGLVRQIATDAEILIKNMNGANPPLQPGYRIKWLDGNSIESTEHRLKVLRDTKAGALPGKSLVVFDQELGIVTDVFPCENGHTQERLILHEVSDTIKPNDLWIADRNFCVLAFLFMIHNKSAFFIIRQHGNFPFNPLTDLEFIGKSETGNVFEQEIEIVDENGEKLKIRRIVVELEKSNRSGDNYLAILTNLPSKTVNAIIVSDLYRTRWKIETAFQKLEKYLNSEINTLAYPKAALFGFSLALIAFNMYAIVMAALRATYPKENINETVSEYYIAQEIEANTGGMMVIVEQECWDAISKLSLMELANLLLYVANYVDLRKYKKNKRGPKKPPLKKDKFVGHPHVATKKLLDEARANKRRAARAKLPKKAA